MFTLNRYLLILPAIHPRSLCLSVSRCRVELESNVSVVPFLAHKVLIIRLTKEMTKQSCIWLVYG